MTQLAFHTGLPDKLGYACRLLRKAWRQGAQVVVVGGSEELGRLDQQLWTFEQEEFVPHLRWRPGSSLSPTLGRSPIHLITDGHLTDDAFQAVSSATVLVNIGQQLPAQAPRFDRVIELVSTDAADVASARERWRQYLGLGMAPSNVPFAGPAADNPS